MKKVTENPTYPGLNEKGHLLVHITKQSMTWADCRHTLASGSKDGLGSLPLYFSLLVEDCSSDQLSPSGAGWLQHP